MLKKLMIVVGVLVLLVVGAVAAVFLSINAIAKSAIVKGGEYATGSAVSVSSVNVGVFKGEFSLSGLRIDNPSGFTSPHFLTIGGASTAVSLKTLRQPTVEIPHFTLDGLDVNLENKGGLGSSSSNYGVILDNIKKVTGGNAADQSTGDGKKFIIKTLTLTKVTVKVDAAGMVLPGGVGDAVGGITKVTIPIDKIELQDVGKGQGGVGDSGVTMEQLTGIIVKAVLAAAAEKGGGLIPTELLGDLQGKLTSLASLDSLSKGGMQIVAGARGTVEDIGKKVGDGVKGATKGVGDAIKGVFGGSKDGDQK